MQLERLQLLNLCVLHSTQGKRLLRGGCGGDSQLCGGAGGPGQEMLALLTDFDNT